MASRLFRVSVLATACIAALGVVALATAAPHAATTDRRDSLAADAAAAGETARDRPVPPSAAVSAPPDQDDAIGDIIATSPPPDEITETPFDLPYPAAARPIRHHRALPAHRRVEAIHPHRTPAPVPVRAPAPVQAPPRPQVLAEVRPLPRAPIVRPHRLHIIVRPPAHAALSPEAAPPPVDANLPEVEAAQAPPVSLDAQMAALTQIAVADMDGARLELSPDLAAGRAGAVVVRLPARLFADLEAKAEDMGFGADARSLSITVALSAQGYDVLSDQALSSPVQPGQGADFSWRLSPNAASAGALRAAMTGSLQLDGEPVSFPLGVLTADIPPPAAEAAAPQAAPEAVPAPAPIVAPTPDLGERLRARLARIGLPNLPDIDLHALAIPGRPTIDVPLVGEVASYKVVAVGLVLLLLMFLRSLQQGATVRAERRRRFETFDRGHFGDELR